jgi:hypothetical protein
VRDDVVVAALGPELSDAIIVWTGFDEYAWPQRSAERLAGRFGAEAADALVPQIVELEDEFYASDARHVAGDLAEMGAMASARFRELHPEITECAIQALAWCYTFDYK